MKKIVAVGVIIIGLLLMAIPAYLIAVLFVDDTSEEFLSWFVVTYVILSITILPLGYLAAKHGKGETSSERSKRSEEYSFWNVPKGKSLTTGMKLKKYDPEGWRKKNGTNLFKRSGRRSKLNF